MDSSSDTDSLDLSTMVSNSPNMADFEKYLKCRLYRVTLEHEQLTKIARKKLRSRKKIYRRQGPTRDEEKSDSSLSGRESYRNKQSKKRKNHQDTSSAEESDSSTLDSGSKRRKQHIEAENKSSNKKKNNDPKINNNEATWPDGDLYNVCVPASNIISAGKIPYFGWATCQNGQKTLSHGQFRRWLYCLGVYKCTNCDFVLRPLLPSSRDKRLGAPPRPPKQTCPIHNTKELQWIPCTGCGDGNPCRIIITYMAGKTSQEHMVFTHLGNHNHPKPPVNKPSPESLRELQKTVTQNPDLLPTKLCMGTDSNKPVSEIDAAFHNKDRVSYFRRQILEKNMVLKESGVALRP